MTDHFDRLGIEHPARYRDRLTGWDLGLPLVAPFLLWGTRLVVKFFALDAVCSPYLEPDVRQTEGVRYWIAALDIIVLALLLGLTLLALRNWRRVRGEHTSRHRLFVDIGEGRTATMAHWGLLMSGAFVLVALFDSVPTLLAPICAN